MLLNLLPGLRELRTPLAAGYTLVLVGYLFVSEEMPRLLDTQHGVASHIDALVTSLGSTVSLAALSFAAYILGVLFEGTLRNLPHPSRLIPRRVQSRLPDWIKKRLWNRSSISRRAAYYLVQSRFESALENSPELRERLDDLVDKGRALRSKSAKHPVADNSAETEGLQVQTFIHRIAHVDVYRHLDQLQSELQQIPSRLLGKDPELWSSWDRLDAEGDFRFVMSYCLCVSSLALSLAYTPLWLICLPACFQLLRLANGKRDEAEVTLISALLAGRISSASVDRLDRGEFYLYENGQTVIHDFQ